MTWIENGVRTFIRRHDRLSARRQRTIANFIIYANVLFVLVYLLATTIWEWRFEFGPVGRLLVAVCWTISLLCLVVASGLFGTVAGWIEDLGPHPRVESSVENAYLVSMRKFFFYAGGLMNIFAALILVEQSGGLIRSPFNSVLYGMILAGQQLGRFRSNSKFFIWTGLIVTLLALSFESLAGVRPVSEPPRQLVFFILALSFLSAALFTHIEKRVNQRVSTVAPSVSVIEIYLDPHNIWRKAMYAADGEIDPPIAGLAEGVSLSDVKEHIQQEVARDASLLGVMAPEVRWHDSYSPGDGYEASALIRSRNSAS